MPSRGQLLKFPEVVHKSVSSNDESTKITKTTEIAPGIFAFNHKAEQKFWQHQASHMQKLAKSANVKNKYQFQMNTLKKDLKVARSELRGIKGQLNAVLPNTEEEDGLPKSADEPEEASAEVKHEQSETVCDLRDRIGRLETAFATVTLQRDNLQNELDASEASFTDISDEFSKCHDELENIKSKALVWQAAIEQRRVDEEKQRRTISELQTQLTKSTEALEAERAESKITGAILKKTSARLGGTQTLLKMSKSKLQSLQAECDILQQERTAATKTQADLVYAAHAKDIELAKTQQELRAACDKVAELEGQRVALDTAVDAEDIAATSGTTIETPIKKSLIVELKFKKPIGPIAEDTVKSGETSNTYPPSDIPEPPFSSPNHSAIEKYDPTAPQRGMPIAATVREDVEPLISTPDPTNKAYSTLKFTKIEAHPNNPFSKLTPTPLGESSDDDYDTKSAILDSNKLTPLRASQGLAVQSEPMVDSDAPGDEVTAFDGNNADFPDEDYGLFLQELESTPLAGKTSSTWDQSSPPERVPEQPSFSSFADLVKATKAEYNDNASETSLRVEQAATAHNSMAFNPTVSEFIPRHTSTSWADDEEEEVCIHDEVATPNAHASVEAKPALVDWPTSSVAVASSSIKTPSIQSDEAPSPIVEKGSVAVPAVPKPQPNNVETSSSPVNNANAAVQVSPEPQPKKVEAPSPIINNGGVTVQATPQPHPIEIEPPRSLGGMMSSRWASDASDKVTSTPSPALSHRPNLRKPSPPPSLMSSKWAPTGANTKDDAHTDGIDQRSIMDEGAVKGAIMAMAGLVVGNP
jgi:division protein CdvB (Snf7/Vps24/ESCRT-III family)